MKIHFFAEVCLEPRDLYKGANKFIEPKLQLDDTNIQYINTYALLMVQLYMFVYTQMISLQVANILQ